MKDSNSPFRPGLAALAPALALALACLAALPSKASADSASSPAKRLVPEWSGGFQAGYSLGQNGQAWPEPWREPLANRNRGGFYLTQARVGAVLPFDSTFSAVIAGNLVFADLLEAYLLKDFGSWRLKAGKLRGAGLRTGSGMDEFEHTTAVSPRYARVWAHHKRVINFRDFGVQGEKDFLGGRVRNRLFFHNANGQNVVNDEPSFAAGNTTQALGLDYALDVRVSPYSTVGGHVGALADRQWDEFLGNHDFWQANYWLKSNAVLDGSLYHQMDFPRLHLLSEVMALSNRTLPHPATGKPLRAWGASTLARFDPSRKWSPFLGYEFFDNSDGLVPDDALHIVRLGTLYRPAPEAYPGMRVTAQYTRALEDGGLNSVGNDILYLQLQSVF